MKRRFWFSFIVLFIILFGITLFVSSPRKQPVAEPGVQLVTQRTITSPSFYLWKVRSVDTMKYSRDRAQDALHDPSFDSVIERQIKFISELGATHVAIATPYDEEFVPVLTRWVTITRKHGLKIWFRGNWSSWEGWFGYAKNLTPEDHLVNTRSFIASHPALFEDGDIFDPCPECENGGVWKKSKETYEAFVPKLRAAAQDAFEVQKKDVRAVVSMSGGRVETLPDSFFVSFGKTLAIDHYDDSEGYKRFLSSLEKKKFSVLWAEFGAPVPGVQALFGEEEQKHYVKGLFDAFSLHRNVLIGVNYWVLNGGPSGLLRDDGGEKPVVDIMRDYFRPGVITGTVTDTKGGVVSKARVTFDDGYSVVTDSGGKFQAVVAAGKRRYTVSGSKSHPATHYFVDVIRDSESVVVIRL